MLARRFLVSTVAGVVGAAALPVTVFADAIGNPVDPMAPPIEYADTYLPLTIGLLGIAVAVVVIAFLRPTWRRWIAATVVGLIGSFAGLFLILGGFLGDFSGNHRVYWILVVPGLLIVIGALAGAVLIGRSGARTTGAASATSAADDPTSDAED